MRKDGEARGRKIIKIVLAAICIALAVAFLLLVWTFYQFGRSSGPFEAEAGAESLYTRECALHAGFFTGYDLALGDLAVRFLGHVLSSANADRRVGGY